MNLRLYANGRIWLVVPGCMLLPKSVTDKYGPLEYVGKVNYWLAMDEVDDILKGFESQCCAEISEALGKRLMESINWTES